MENNRSSCRLKRVLHYLSKLMQRISYYLPHLSFNVRARVIKLILERPASFLVSITYIIQQKKFSKTNFEGCSIVLIIDHIHHST